MRLAYKQLSFSRYAKLVRASASHNYKRRSRATINELPALSLSTTARSVVSRSCQALLSFASSVVFLRSRHDRVALSPRVLQHSLCGLNGNWVVHCCSDRHCSTERRGLLFKSVLESMLACSRSCRILLSFASSFVSRSCRSVVSRSCRTLLSFASSVVFLRAS